MNVQIWVVSHWTQILATVGAMTVVNQLVQRFAPANVAKVVNTIMVDVVALVTEASKALKTPAP